MFSHKIKAKPLKTGRVHEQPQGFKMLGVYIECNAQRVVLLQPMSIEIASWARFGRTFQICLDMPP